MNFVREIENIDLIQGIENIYKSWKNCFDNHTYIKKISNGEIKCYNNIIEINNIKYNNNIDNINICIDKKINITIDNDNNRNITINNDNNRNIIVDNNTITIEIGRAHV